MHSAWLILLWVHYHHVVGFNQGTNPDAAHPTIVRLRQNCSLSHHQNKPWYCIEDRAKMDLITADNGVSADGGLQGTLGVSLPKSLPGRGFFVVVYLPPLFPFSSWAASWQKLSMRVKGPPMTWSTPKMWRRAGTNTRPCVRFVRATPNNVLMSLSPCETGLLLLLHDKRLGRWWIQTTGRYFRRVGAHDCTGRSFPRHNPRGWQWGSDDRQSYCTSNLKYSSCLQCIVWWAELLLKHQTVLISLKYSYASQPCMIINLRVI